jgi:hypothetical protein
MIYQSSQINQPDETSSRPSNKTSESLSFISSPKQHTSTASLSPLPLSSTMSVVMKKSPISSDISNSSAELPFQPKLSSYPTNKQNSGGGAYRLVRLESHLFSD